jgi:multidrug resistance efflux pump
MRSKAKMAAAAALALSFTGALWAYQGSRGPELLQAAGTIEARDIQVGSLVGGRVTRVHVQEGEAATAGQALVSLEPDLLELQIVEQRARVSEARARFALVREGPRTEELARARVEWETAEKDRRRMEELYRQGITPQQQYEAVSEIAATRLEVLREHERGSRTADIEAARASFEREEGRLAYLLRQREETVVVAPAAGLVQTLDLRPGDLVAAGQPVATLLEPSQLWIRVYVPETKLAYVRRGEAAQVFIDGFPGRAFPATITEISPRAEYTPRNIQTLDQRSDQVFGVKVVPAPAPELKPGMAAVAVLGRAEAE